MQEKGKALEAIRNLIAYYTSDFQVGNGYTGKQQLVYLTPPQAEIALRYVTISDLENLKRWLAFDSMEPLASIHADLPRRVQQKLREFILQIMEIECPEKLPPQKPAAPILGLHGDIFNLLCITNRTLRQAGQMEQAEEMWRRVLESGDSYKAISIMGEYVEFDEAYPSTAVLKTGGSRGDLSV